MDDARTAAALEGLLRSARMTAVARRLEGDTEDALLRSVADAAVTLFGAEAASIALHVPERDELEFRVAAGAQGEGVVGLSVPATSGIVGYVFGTGEAIALSDVAADPRFDQSTAERTGYVPRSIAAVPLTDGGSTVGVLQVLDKADAATFSLTDMQLLGVFARQAAAAIATARVGRDSERLLRQVLRAVGDVGDDREADEALDAEAIDALVAAAAAELDEDADEPFWGLVDTVARLRGAPGTDLALVGDILEAVARRSGRGRSGGGREGGYRRRGR